MDLECKNFTAVYCFSLGILLETVMILNIAGEVRETFLLLSIFQQLNNVQTYIFSFAWDDYPLL